MAIQVRNVGPEAFDEVAPLLDALPNDAMSKADWRWVLFEYPWATRPPCGWALYAGEKIVGFIGALFSTRHMFGRVEKFCNPSCWIVLEQHRYAGPLLLSPIFALKDHTIVSLSPSPTVYKVFLKLGMQPLESEQLVLPPIPRPAEVVHALRGSFTVDTAEIRASFRPTNVSCSRT